MITIYTDASVKKQGKTCGAALVLTDSNYLGYDIRQLDTDVPQVAEARACVNAVEYAAKICPMLGNENATLYCDNKVVCDLVNSETYNGKLSVEINPLRSLLKKYGIRIEHIKGHSDTQNPNVAVDLFLRSQ